MTLTADNPLVSNDLSHDVNILTEATITEDLRQRVLKIIDEQNALFLERSEIIHGVWVARIAQQHVVMVGPGGTGKTMVARNTAEHIEGSVFFEATLDEQSDLSEVTGPPNIKAMAEEGRTLRVVEGFLPVATDAMIDEVFNGNKPVLHAIMPIMNERVHHNDGQPIATPLRQILAGTNKLTIDPDLAAMFDRFHHRYDVNYVRSRSSMYHMLAGNVARMQQRAALGSGARGAGTRLQGLDFTTIHLDELDRALLEALSLDIPDSVLEAMAELREELSQSEAQVNISDRRWNESAIAVMANAWLRGHKEVTIGDLDILSGMWWTTLEQAPIARKIILAATNPSEKIAMELLDKLDELEKEYRETTASEKDESLQRRICIDLITNAESVIKEAEAEIEKCQAAGVGYGRLTETKERGNGFTVKVGKEVFKWTSVTAGN